MDAILSIIVPVYKAEKRLPLCINSVLQQTFPDFELILVDDGSTDQSGAICDEYASRDKRIRVIHKENGGVSSARNVGLEISKGEYVAFVDSDDIVDRTFLEDCCSLLEKTQTDLCISGIIMETWNNDKIIDLNVYGGIDKVYSVGELFDAKEIDYPTICISGPCCKLYRASIIRQNQLRFDESMSLGEDSCFVHNFLKVAQTVVFTKENYYHYYRGNAASLYSRYHEDFFELYSKTIEITLEAMISHNCSEDAIKQEKIRSVNLLMDSIAKEYQYYERTTPKSRMQVIKNVANHPLIKEVKAKDYSIGASSVIYLAVKYKLYGVANLLLQVRRLLQLCKKVYA